MADCCGMPQAGLGQGRALFCPCVCLRSSSCLWRVGRPPALPVRECPQRDDSTPVSLNGATGLTFRILPVFGRVWVLNFPTLVSRYHSSSGSRDFARSLRKISTRLVV